MQSSSFTSMGRDIHVIKKGNLAAIMTQSTLLCSKHGAVTVMRLAL
jgi:hypothetical protein